MPRRLQTTELNSDVDIARELIRERDHPAWGAAYCRGNVYSMARVARSLWPVGQRTPYEAGSAAVPVAFCFFRNEAAALTRFSSDVTPLQILRFDGLKVGFITREKGLRWVIATLREGVTAIRAVAEKENERSIVVSVLAWLLFRFAVEARHWEIPGGEFVIPNIAHPFSLALLFAFKRRGLRATYVEHALTPKSAMRPLPIDKIFFHSAHSLRTWQRTQRDSRVELLLMSAGAELTPATYPLPRDPRILICLNDLDSPAATEMMVRASLTLTCAVVVRLHESDARNRQIGALARSLGAFISLAKDSDIASDFSRSDLVICGNSNILLDGLRAGKRLVYFWSGDPEMFDYYGAVAYYGIDSATSRSGLEQLLASISGGPQPGAPDARAP